MPEASSTINVTELIDQRPLTELQIRVVALCALMIFLDGADTIMMGLVAPSLAATIGVSANSFGPVFGISQAGFCSACSRSARSATASGASAWLSGRRCYSRFSPW